MDVFFVSDVWLPWDQAVDPFWKTVVSGLVVFPATVALAAYFFQRQQSADREKVRNQDLKYRDALLASLFTEIATNRGWVKQILKCAELARDNRRFTSWPSSRPRQDAWRSSQAELIRLGVPGVVVGSVERAYHAIGMATGWVDVIEQQGQRRLMAVASADSEEHLLPLAVDPVRRFVERHDAAAIAMEDYANKNSIDLLAGHDIEAMLEAQLEDSSNLASPS